MKPYSQDLRLRVLAAAVDTGSPTEQVAMTFSVSMPTIMRWLNRRREETADLEPKPIPPAGGPPGEGHDAPTVATPPALKANHDLLTLQEHREALEEELLGEEAVSTSTMGRASPGFPTQEDGRSEKVAQSPRTR